MNKPALGGFGACMPPDGIGNPPLQVGNCALPLWKDRLRFTKIVMAALDEKMT
jgi:hypothetical protein